MTRPTGLEAHPDIVQMRAKYETASSSMVAQMIDGLTLLAGLYLAISPWVVGFNGLSRLAVNNMVIGLALAALALGFASAYGRTHGLTWIAPILGVWTILSPWIIRSATTSSIWNNVVTGIVILLLGLGAMAVGNRHIPTPAAMR
ncbi:SPW repeat protein [Sphaerisporangium sp. TRM90804]|uniref:SPW repeat protein n=1 Tax=Sphaerisporangium sp. TRM90804 TaxID=3031113 RepID=UPI002449AF9A|nr:SPW repeat protein [Sphaerisporangium sp. TRM90804]MDH2427348.1 SPW repeat protein [Sphaerisporangium sp. TRM90804]